MANIRDCIRLMAAPDGETVPLVCTVESVDKKTRTVDCIPLNEGAPLLGVNLQANQGSDFGLVLFPKVGAFVVVGFIAGGAAPVMLCADELESAEIVIGKMSAVIDSGAITFNGGALGGMVKVAELTEKLNGLKDTVNALISTFNTHTHVTTATVGASANPGILSPPASQATPAIPFVRADYENEKVKH